VCGLVRDPTSAATGGKISQSGRVEYLVRLADAEYAPPGSGSAVDGSALANPSHRLEGLDAAAEDRLGKPFDIDP